MNLLQRVMRGHTEARYDFSDWAADKMVFGGMTYPLFGGVSALSTSEEIDSSFSGYIGGAYKANGVVFATILARMLLFTEARFQYQDMGGGRPGELSGGADLEVLERPWPNGATGELLARMEQDVSLGGNAYVAREGKRLRRLRPDWVSIILTAPPAEAVESDVAGYLYRPGGYAARSDAKLYLPGELAHWSPIPDPEAQYRGMSWLTPVVREIQADKATTLHKLKFFENGATPNLTVALKETVSKTQFEEFMQVMNASHQGVHNAYKTMYLGGGADVRVVGADLKQLDFKSTQGAGETRITAAGGVPAVIVGLSEGLQAATYSNYGQARRKFGDHWARPQWRSVCSALSSIVRVPAGSRLWFDDRDIPFLREDQRDQAEIQGVESRTIRTLLDAGYKPESVTAAVVAQDWTLLEHTGLFSVQLQPPGSGAPAAIDSPKEQ